METKLRELLKLQELNLAKIKCKLEPYAKPNDPRVAALQAELCRKAVNA